MFQSHCASLFFLALSIKALKQMFALILTNTTEVCSNHFYESFQTMN